MAVPGQAECRADGGGFRGQGLGGRADFLDFLGDLVLEGREVVAVAVVRQKQTEQVLGNVDGGFPGVLVG